MPAVAYLARIGSASAGAIADDRLAAADLIVHVAAPDEQVVQRYERSLRRALPGGASVRTLTGQVLPPDHTGRLMHNFSYGHQVLQQPGATAPNSFLLPLSKTSSGGRSRGSSATPTCCPATTTGARSSPRAMR